MKVLIVGSDRVNTVRSVENYYYEFLRENKVDVKCFPSQSLFYDYYSASFFNKIKFKLHISNIYKKINAHFLETVEVYNPDIILVFKGLEINTISLEKIKKKGIILANYNPDNPFIFSGRGSGNRNITNSLHLYDLLITYNFEIEKEIKEKLKIKTKILPFGFDYSDDLFLQCQNEKEIIKCCFVGNPDKNRAELILKLAKRGVEIDVYGNNWIRFLQHRNIEIHSAVHDDEFCSVLRKYRIQLNIMRIHNLNSHNMRSFEIPGIGGIMLAPNTKEHQLYFKNEKEIFLYNDFEDCLKKIDFILKMSVQEAEEVRNNARKKSISNGYSYRDRAIVLQKMLENINE